MLAVLDAACCMQKLYQVCSLVSNNVERTFTTCYFCLQSFLKRQTVDAVLKKLLQARGQL